MNIVIIISQVNNDATSTLKHCDEFYFEKETKERNNTHRNNQYVILCKNAI